MLVVHDSILESRVAVMAEVGWIGRIAGDVIFIF